MDDNNSGERYKVIIIGDSAVGKSSIASRQCNSDFDIDISPTIGSAHFITNIQLGERTVTLVIWDTAGQEEFAPLVPMYSRKSNCALIVAACDSPESINRMKKWEEMLLQSGERPSIIAVINKMDLAKDETKTIDEIKLKLKDSFDEIFFVSAKTGANIQELFLAVATKCIAISELVQDGPELKPKSRKKACC